MAEQSSRTRRIAKRAVWTLAVVVLLPVGYVASFVTFHFAWAVGVVPPPVAEWLLGGFYSPLDWYIGENNPGSRAILTLIDMAANSGFELGRRIPK